MRNKLISVIFLVIIIFVPIITMVSRTFFDDGEQSASNEGFSAVAEVNDFLADIPFRKSLARFNTIFTKKITGASYINSTQVILGKNEWLYLKDTQDDYEHTNCFSEKEKQRILEQLLFQREVFAKMGMEFVIYIAPNKATIYPENMPDTVFTRNSPSRAEDLIDYIRSNSDLKVIWPKEELLGAKEVAPIYYVTDTHWNEAGGYVGAQVFLKEMFGFEDKFLPDMISVREEYREGDLARIGNVSDVFKEYTLYSISPLSIDRTLYADKSIYFVGDSFRDAISYYLPYYVKNVAFLHYEDFNCLDMLMYEPDIIVWEIVERNIDKYLELDLAKDIYVAANDGTPYYLPSDAFVGDYYGVRYFSDESGYAQDSLINEMGLLYYFDENGYMVTDCLKEIWEHTYYFNALGMAEQGWVLKDDNYYYFNEEFHMVKSDWIKTEKDEWYYMTEDGTMLTDAYTPDGYYVNENGQWLQ